MKGFNKVILAGNLTRDPELRYTAGGLAIARITVAVNRAWKDGQTGELKEEVNFIDVDALGKSAETIGQYLRKGRPILIEGRLKLDTWEDKQTQQKRSKLVVVLETFTFLDSGGTRDGGGEMPSGAPPAPRPRPQAPAAPPPPSSTGGGGEPDAMPPEEQDDVPF
jgi:single-strand DNA-binding protein